MNWIKKRLQKLLSRIRGLRTVDELVAMGMTVGKNFNPQIGVMLDDSHCWLITIGDDVTMAPNVHILAHDASTCQALGYAKIGRVDIGNRVFIGAGSVVLPGVEIGDDVIVGAGSVVTHSLPGGYVYAGNPAKEVATIHQFVEKHKAIMQERPCYDESYTLRNHISMEKRMEQKQALSDGIGYVI